MKVALKALGVVVGISISMAALWIGSYVLGQCPASCANTWWGMPTFFTSLMWFCIGAWIAVFAATYQPGDKS